MNLNLKHLNSRLSYPLTQPSVFVHPRDCVASCSVSCTQMDPLPVYSLHNNQGDLLKMQTRSCHLPSESFNGSPSCSDGGKIAKVSCSLAPLISPHSSSLCSSHTGFYSDLSLNAIRLPTTGSLHMLFPNWDTPFHLRPHNKSYLSRLTPVPQFSPPPGHPP